MGGARKTALASSTYAPFTRRLLTLTGWNWKCHVIIVIKTDLSGFIVPMHSGLCEQYVKSYALGIWLPVSHNNKFHWMKNVVRKMRDILSRPQSFNTVMLRMNNSCETSTARVIQEMGSIAGIVLEYGTFWGRIIPRNCELVNGNSPDHNIISDKIVRDIGLRMRRVRSHCATARTAPTQSKVADGLNRN